MFLLGCLLLSVPFLLFVIVWLLKDKRNKRLERDILLERLVMFSVFEYCTTLYHVATSVDNPMDINKFVERLRNHSHALANQPGVLDGVNVQTWLTDEFVYVEISSRHDWMGLAPKQERFPASHFTGYRN